MKIIEYHATAQNVTELPAEIIEVIIQYVQLRRSPRVAQRDTWSCCLVAQAWYAVAIKHLYQAPLILQHNFPEFARTLSPPLSSRTRRIGLEDLVEHLDMGVIAYESQKSTTSRLLSRTRQSLKSFVAPAVSFSTTSLAPLSKCSRLQQLDLSRDQYDFTLDRLLRSIKVLSRLEWLSLPKECPATTDALGPLSKDSWPPSLTFIQFNTSRTVAFTSSSSNLIPKLPEQLTTLTFNNCISYDFFDFLDSNPTSQITKLCVRVNRCDGWFNFNSIIRPFPNAIQLSIPAMTQWHFADFNLSEDGNSWSLIAANKGVTASDTLEILTLEESPDFPFSDHIRMSDLEQFVKYCPRLLRIEVPMAYIDDNNFTDKGMDDMNNALTKRFEHITDKPRSDIAMDQAGVFTTEPKANAGVGLKRSFRYEAER